MARVYITVNELVKLIEQQKKEKKTIPVFFEISAEEKWVNPKDEIQGSSVYKDFFRKSVKLVNAVCSNQECEKVTGKKVTDFSDPVYAQYLNEQLNKVFKENGSIIAEEFSQNLLSGPAMLFQSRVLFASDAFLSTPEEGYKNYNAVLFDDQGVPTISTTLYEYIVRDGKFEFIFPGRITIDCKLLENADVPKKGKETPPDDNDLTEVATEISKKNEQSKKQFFYHRFGFSSATLKDLMLGTITLDKGNVYPTLIKICYEDLTTTFEEGLGLEDFAIVGQINEKNLQNIVNKLYELSQNDQLNKQVIFEFLNNLRVLMNEPDNASRFNNYYKSTERLIAEAETQQIEISEFLGEINVSLIEFLKINIAELKYNELDVFLLDIKRAQTGKIVDSQVVYDLLQKLKGLIEDPLSEAREKEFEKNYQIFAELFEKAEGQPLYAKIRVKNIVKRIKQQKELLNKKYSIYIGQQYSELKEKLGNSLPQGQISSLKFVDDLAKEKNWSKVPKESLEIFKQLTLIAGQTLNRSSFDDIGQNIRNISENLAALKAKLYLADDIEENFDKQREISAELYKFLLLTLLNKIENSDGFKELTGKDKEHFENTIKNIIKLYEQGEIKQFEQCYELLFQAGVNNIVALSAHSVINYLSAYHNIANKIESAELLAIDLMVKELAKLISAALEVDGAQAISDLKERLFLQYEYGVSINDIGLLYKNLTSFLEANNNFENRKKIFDFFLDKLSKKESVNKDQLLDELAEFSLNVAFEELKSILSKAGGNSQYAEQLFAGLSNDSFSKLEQYNFILQVSQVIDLAIRREVFSKNDKNLNVKETVDGLIKKFPNSEAKKDSLTQLFLETNRRLSIRRLNKIAAQENVNEKITGILQTLDGILSTKKYDFDEQKYTEFCDHLLILIDKYKKTSRDEQAEFFAEFSTNIKGLFEQSEIVPGAGENSTTDELNNLFRNIEMLLAQVEANKTAVSTSFKGNRKLFELTNVAVAAAKNVKLVQVQSLSDLLKEISNDLLANKLEVSRDVGSYLQKAQREKNITPEQEKLNNALYDFLLYIWRERLFSAQAEDEHVSLVYNLNFADALLEKLLVLFKAGKINGREAYKLTALLNTITINPDDKENISSYIDLVTRINENLAAEEKVNLQLPSNLLIKADRLWVSERAKLPDANPEDPIMQQIEYVNDEIAKLREKIPDEFVAYNLLSKLSQFLQDNKSVDFAKFIKELSESLTEDNIDLINYLDQLLFLSIAEGLANEDQKSSIVNYLAFIKSLGNFEKKLIKQKKSLENDIEKYKLNSVVGKEQVHNNQKDRVLRINSLLDKILQMHQCVRNTAVNFTERDQQVVSEYFEKLIAFKIECDKAGYSSFVAELEGLTKEHLQLNYRQKENIFSPALQKLNAYVGGGNHEKSIEEQTKIKYVAKIIPKLEKAYRGNEIDFLTAYKIAVYVDKFIKQEISRKEYGDFINTIKCKGEVKNPELEAGALLSLMNKLKNAVCYLPRIVKNLFFEKETLSKSLENLHVSSVDKQAAGLSGTTARLDN